MLWGVFAVISLAYFSIIMDIFIIVWTIVVLIKSNKKIVEDYKLNTNNK